MCGLIGVFDHAGEAIARRAALQRGRDAIAHRGPDDAGEHFDGPVGLGFRRLSILDLSPAGHQPMTSADGAWVVAFNGEVYNFLELRRELQGRGAAFRSDTDTEVLVELLARDGVDALARLNGMWALLALHVPSQTLWLSRDPWGIKPLYVCEQRGHVVFASEIKALAAFGCDLGGVDAAVARRFLVAHELDRDDRTLWLGVRRLPAGALWGIRRGVAIEQRSLLAGDWGTALADDPGPAASADAVARWDADYVDAFRDALLSSVRLRMRADVDAGTCLSGGLDSTAIACATGRFLDAERAGNCRHAFTAHSPEYDERRYIEPVVAQIGAQWHVVGGDDAAIASALPAFRRAHDQPVQSLAPFAGFLLMRAAAAAGVKVLLNGQGADELLAGYPSSVLPWLRSLVREQGVAAALAEASACAHGRAGGLRLLAQAIAGMGLRRLPLQLEAAARALRSARSRHDASRMLRHDGPLGEAELESAPASALLQPHLLANCSESPLPLFLRVEDINSSAWSLEARLPFLDPHVVGLARRAPARLLRRGDRNKHLLRAVLPGLVPDVVWQRRDKMGFPVPHGRWLRGPLRPLIDEVLDRDALRARGWYDVDAVLAAKGALLAATTPGIDQALLRVLLLEMWARDHLDAGLGVGRSRATGR